MSETVSQLWSRHRTVLDSSREFIDWQILDNISGSVLRNKARIIRPIVLEIVLGTDIVVEDVFQNTGQNHNGHHAVGIAVRPI